MKKYTNNIKTIYSDLEITTLLDTIPIECDSILTEDLLIQHNNGDKSCLNWDLRVMGYRLLNQNELYNENTSDKELLADAYNELNKYKKKLI